MAKKFDPNSSEPVFYSLLPDDDTVTGGRGSDTFIGNSIKNFLSGLSGNDVLRGEEDDDTLDGGEGADTLNGGEGNDLFIVDNSRDIVTGGSGVDKVLSSVGYVLASDVENLELTGNNNISGTGNSLANLITGNSGGNLLEGLGGNDTLLGLDGNDLLNGGTGNDSLVGGKGDDTFVVDSAIDKIIELDGEGRDTVRTSATYSLASLSNIENLELTGSSNINGAGNSLNNILSGNVGANSLAGESGSDTLLGLAGNDTLAGGAGNDLINGGGGNDSIDGGEGSSDIADFSSTTNNMVVDLSTSSAIGDGIDILRGIEVVVTGSGADKLVGDANANSLRAGVGNDTLLGGAGNDTLAGGVGADSINGGAGRDAVDYSASAVAVRINLGSVSQLTGEAEGDKLSSIEDVIGSAGKDTIIGDAFANLVEGRAGGDSLLGGAGADTLSYAISSSGVRVNLAQSTLQAFGDAQGDTISGFEHLQGSAFDDTLSGDSSANLIAGGDGADYIDGAKGNDSLLGGVGKDTLVTDSSDSLVDGGDGQDAVISNQSVNLSSTGYVSIEDVYLAGSALTATGNNLANLLVGNSLKNTISGNDGSDTLDGGADADSLVGGAGNDFYFIDNAGDKIVENGPSSDQDTVNTTLANFTLSSDLENLNYIGDANAKLTGNSLNNKISGGKWSDTFIGGAGNDTYFVNNAGDVVVETAGQGADHVISNVSGYGLVDNVEHLSYTGTGNASLLGNALNNSLLGNALNNTLDGNGGVDTLSGGTGNDVYVVDSSTDAIIDASGTDTVLSSVNFDLSNTLAGGGAVIEKLVLTGTAVSGTGNFLANTLTGNSLSNSLDGGAGIDLMVGGIGNDTYFIDNALDNIIEQSGQGNDLVVSKISNYTLADNFENLSYIGNENASLIGNSSNNSILGNSNNNTLEGKDGVDTLSGGSGNDVFVVDSDTDSLLDSSGSDTVISSVSFDLSNSLVGGGEVIENLRYIGIANASLTGNILNNSLVGNYMDNTLNGKGGVDTLSGGSGSDVYVVDSADDTIIDSSGSDTVLSSVSFNLSNSLVGGGAAVENLVLTGSAVSGIGNSLDNTLTGNQLENTLTGGAGNDYLDGQVGNDSMVGGSGNDTYLVDSASDVVSEIAGEGTDLVISSVSGYALNNHVENLTYTGTANASLIGNASNNSLLGNAKDNTLEGKGGIDTFSGGSGNDFYVVDTATDTIVDASGTDTVLSSVSFNLSSSLVGGGASIENLVLAGTAVAATGNSLSNTLSGNSVGNSLDGGAGDDSMDGGAGNDTYFVDSAADAVSEIAGQGTDLVISSVSGYTISDNVENLSYTGTTNASLIGNSSNNSLLGNSNDNTLEGKGGVDTLSGGSGNDVYVVDTATDRIEDASGTDTVLSSVNFDLSNSLAGGGAAIEKLTLTGNATTATGNSLGNTLVGNSIASTLDGGEGDDSLLGGLGNDVLRGGAGRDSLKGGLGNDTYYVSDTLDAIDDAGGSNTIFYSSGLNPASISRSGAGTFTLIEIAASIIGGSGNETLTGNSLNDRIYGQGGNDSLRGLDGDDLLDGGDGNDTLSGSVGIDTLLGGAGTDSLDGGDGNDTLLGDAGQDTLVGGTGADFLDGGDSPDSLVGGSGFDTLVYRTTADTIQGGVDSDLVLAFSDVTLSGSSFTDNIENLLLGDTATTGVGNSISNSITGNDFNNSLSGAGGNDTIDGALGNDTLLGEDGDDSLVGGGGNDSLVGGTGNDTYVIDVASIDTIVESSLIAGGAADLIVVNGSFSMAQVPPPPIGTPKPNIYAGIEALSYSGSANVSLTGNEIANTITAGTGNDYLSGGKGVDTLIGGAGNDTYVYSDKDVIVEATEGGTDQVNSAEDIDLRDSSAQIENIFLTGSLSIGATGNSIDNSILGNAGSNALRGLAGDDTLVGLGGNDLLEGGSGANSLVGGAGNDTYILDATTAEDGSIFISDELLELADGGTDEIRVAADVDLSQLPNFENVVLKGSLSLNVIGNSLSNKIQGNGGDNILDGGVGSDIMSGGAGNDTYYVDDNGDIIQEEAGYGLADLVISSLNSYAIGDAIENLQLIGGDGSAGTGNVAPNLIIGSASNNFLKGGDGDDTLIGGLGDDTLQGDTDSNSLVGGEGDDLYIVNFQGDKIIDSEGDNDIVFLRPNIDAVVRANQNTGSVFNYGAGSITFDSGADTVRGGGAEIFLSLNQLRIGDLNYKPYYPGALLDGNVFKSPNYFFALQQDIENLTVEHQFIPVNNLITDQGQIQPDYIYGNSASNYINITGEGIFREFNSYIDGQGGADTMAGGRGSDIYVVDDANDFVLEAAGEGFDIVRSSVTYTLSGNFEELSLLDVTETIVNGRPVASTLSGAALHFHGYGNSLNNYLYGNAGNNSLFGLDGNDYLSGHNAHDAGGGWGVDSLSGLDTLVGGRGDDIYYIAGTDGADVIVENLGEGTDLVITELSSYSLGANVEKLSYNSSTGASLVGNDLANTIDGATGRDTLFGGDGADSLYGGYDNDSLLGGAGNDTLDGGESNDTLDGGAGSNSLLGGNGDDIFLGITSSDTIDGGVGENKVNFSSAASLSDSAWAYMTNIQSVQLSTSNDSVTLGGNAQERGVRFIEGLDGNDTLTASAMTIAATLSGGNGNDSVVGGTAGDSILGGANNDTLRGEAGNDYLDGGAGTNSLLGGAGNDTLAWSSGSATLDGGDNTDTLLFNVGATVADSDFSVINSIEKLQLSDSADSITLGSTAQAKGINFLIGNGGNDTLNASAMSIAVTLSGDAGADSLLGGTGADSLLGGADSDTLLGGANNDTLLGEEGNDSLLGGDGNDSLFGGNENDTLTGGDGHDTLVLGNGNGIFSGGAGNDSFLLSHANQIGPIGAGGINTVIGGSGTDSLVFTAVVSIGDGQLVNVSGVEAIQAASSTGNSIRIGSNALASGVSTLLGGAAGGDTLSAEGYTGSNARIWIDASGSALGSTLIGGFGDPAFTGGNTLLGGSGGDLIQVATAAVLNNASIVGGNGTDTVQITTDAQVVGDTDLDNLTGVEALQLANGANSITLGDKARGIATVAGGLDIITTGSGSDALTATSDFGNTAITLDGGAGNDRFAFDSATQMAAATLVGGDGTDTLSLGQATILGNDDAFQKVTGMEVLQAATTGESSFVLASDAQDAGIRMVIGGSGKGTLDASAYTVGVTLDASANSNTTANQGATLLGGSGNNSFRLLNNNVLSVSSIVGQSGSDTLAFSQDGLTITDENFTRFANVEAVQTKDGTNYVNLGANVATAGLKTLVGGTGSDTIDATAFNGIELTIDSGDSADFITGSSTASNRILAGDKNDLIILQNAATVARSTVDGGGSDQTSINFRGYEIKVGNALGLGEATSLSDSDFENFKNVNHIFGAIFGNSSFELGSNAQSASIKAIVAGSGDDTLNVSAYSSGTGLTLNGGAGNDLIVFSTAARLGEIYTLDGGTGTDTLSFAVDALSVTDADFTKVSNIEVLKTANGNNRFIFGANAQTGGIATVIGGSGKDTLDASAFTAALTIDGGQGDNSLFGGTGNDSLRTYNGADVLDGGTGADTMVGGTGNDTYYVADETDRVDDEGGTNHIIVQGDVSGYTTVSGGGATFVVQALAEVFGDSLANKNDTLVGTSLKDTISGLTGDDIITGANGADSLLGGDDNDSISGGAGADTILGEDDNDRLLGDAGADSVLGGAGTDSILGGADNDTLLGEAGNDTILGGDGNDSVLGGADADSLMAGVGNDTILGEAGNDTLVADATGTASLVGGDDNDSFLFTSGTQLANNTVVGGAGTEDKLVLTAATTLADAQLARVSGVEAIQASSLAGNSITVGANAVAGGVLSLFGGASSDLLSAAGMVSGNIWIQGDAVGGTSTLGDTLIAGVGSSRATLVGNNSATADNYFQISTASLLGNNSIVGGSNSDDYLQITGSNQTLLDASFAQVSDLNGLILSGGLNSITLGVTAQAKFGATISLTGGTGGGSGADTINLSATTKKVYLDASAGSNGDTITAGTNDNTLIGGAAASANDLFIFTSESNLNGASVVGGGGTDTLRLSANGQTVLTTALDKLSSIEVFDLAGAGNNITLGAISAGIATIVGGTGPNTFNAASYNSSPNALTWNMNASNGSDSLLGGANGNLFQIKNGANLQNSVITGNTGNDTIQLLAGAQTLGDSAFSKISGNSIEQLVLGSAVTNGNSITLGTTAASKGIATVIGGTRRDTINASGFGDEIWIDASASSGARLVGSTTAPLGNTLIGGSAGGNEFVVGSLGANSIVGGSNGLDTLTFSSVTTINDSVQNGQLHDGSTASISKVGTIEFNAAGNNIVLGQDALIAGIRTLVGGAGSDNGTGNTFNTSAYGSAGVLFQITDQDYLSNVTAIIGGTGVDTLKFSRDGVSVTDENVAKLTNIDVLRTANGNNHFLIHDDFVAAGIDSMIGGTGRDTIDMSDNAIYTPTGVADMITMDMSAGSGYTLISSTDDLTPLLPPILGNFRWAKVIGGSVAGSVILDGPNLADADFENMYQANIGTLFMRSGSDNTVVLGENARGTGLDTLTMSDGNDVIDVTDFLGTLAVNGGGGNDRVDTSFAALASLTFTGGGGNDTLRLVSAEARSITSLTGSYEAFALEAGNNFVLLANDAGLSTIFGGNGGDTISMLSNTTGINFVMDATRLGNGSGFASLDGGSGSDTLTVHSVGATFADAQFSRVGSVNWADDTGAIENFVTEAGVGDTYTFGRNAYDAGIRNIYARNGQNLIASAFDDGNAGTANDRALNFVFDTAANAASANITGTGAVGNDTLTLTTDSQIVNNVTFAGTKVSLETLILANGTNSVTLDTNANTTGIRVVVGGSGNDALTFNTTEQTSLVFNGGAQTTFDSATISNSGAALTDAYFDDWASVERLTTANGNNDIALGANAVAGGIATVTGGTGNDTFNATAYTAAITLAGNDGNDSLLSGSGNDSLSGGNGTDWLQATSATSAGGNQIDTLTGGAGADTFVLGDASNAYYNSNAPGDIRGDDLVLITDFATGDRLQLKNLNPAAIGNGYVVGDALYGVFGSSNYYIYRDANNDNTANVGDNLIAAINSSVALTTANLKSTHGIFV